MKILSILLLSISAFSQGVSTVPGGIGKTSNNVILRGSGNALPAKCTVGQQFFKSNATAGQNLYGCTSANTWTLQGGGTSGLTLIQQATASGSSSLDFTSCISSTYDDYLIKFIQLVPATNAVHPFIRFSTNGGSSYVSTTDYTWYNLGFSYSGQGLAGGPNKTEIQLTGGTSVANTSTYGVNGYIYIFNPGGSGYKRTQGDIAIGNDATVTHGVYLSATAVNAFQFLFSSGNVASGTVRCYGMAK